MQQLNFGVRRAAGNPCYDTVKNTANQCNKTPSLTINAVVKLRYSVLRRQLLVSCLL